MNSSNANSNKNLQTERTPKMSKVSSTSFFSNQKQSKNSPFFLQQASNPIQLLSMIVQEIKQSVDQSYDNFSKLFDYQKQIIIPKSMISPQYKQQRQLLKTLKKSMAIVGLFIQKNKNNIFQKDINLQNFILVKSNSEQPTFQRNRDLFLSLIPLLSNAQYWLNQCIQKILTSDLKNKSSSEKFSYPSEKTQTKINQKKEGTFKGVYQLKRIFQIKIKQLIELIYEVSYNQKLPYLKLKQNLKSQQQQTPKLQSLIKGTQKNSETNNQLSEKYQNQLIQYKRTIQNLNQQLSFKQVQIDSFNNSLQLKIIEIQKEHLNEITKKVQEYQNKMISIQMKHESELKRIELEKKYQIEQMRDKKEDQLKQILKQIKSFFQPATFFLQKSIEIQDFTSKQHSNSQNHKLSNKPNEHTIKTNVRLLQMKIQFFNQTKQIVDNELSMLELHTINSCMTGAYSNYFASEIAKLNDFMSQLFIKMKQSVILIIQLDKQQIQRQEQLKQLKLEFSQLSNLKDLFKNMKLKNETMQEISSLKSEIIRLKNIIEKFKQNQETQNGKRIQQAINFMRRKQIENSKRMHLQSNLNTNMVQEDYRQVASRIQLLTRRNVSLQVKLNQMKQKHSNLSQQNQSLQSCRQQVKIEMQMQKETIKMLKQQLDNNHIKSFQNIKTIRHFSQICDQINSIIESSIQNIGSPNPLKDQLLMSQYSSQKPQQLILVIKKAVQIYSSTCSQWKKLYSQSENVLNKVIQVFQIQHERQSDSQESNQIVDDSAKEQIKAQKSNILASQYQNQQEQLTSSKKSEQNINLNKLILNIQSQISILSSQIQQKQHQNQSHPVIKRSVSILQNILKLSEQIRNQQTQIFARKDQSITELQKTIETKQNKVDQIGKRITEKCIEINNLNDQLSHFNNVISTLQGIGMHFNQPIRRTNPQSLNSISLTPTARLDTRRQHSLSFRAQTHQPQSSVSLSKTKQQKVKKNSTAEIEQNERENQTDSKRHRKPEDEWDDIF